MLWGRGLRLTHLGGHHPPTPTPYTAQQQGTDKSMAGCLHLGLPGRGEEKLVSEDGEGTWTVRVGPEGHGRM